MIRAKREAVVIDEAAVSFVRKWNVLLLVVAYPVAAAFCFDEFSVAAAYAAFRCVVVFVVMFHMFTSPSGFAGNPAFIKRRLVRFN